MAIYDSQLKPCNHCGGTAKFTNRRACFGHGDYTTVWYATCDCGIQTIGLAEGYDGDMNDCRRKALEIWNRRADLLQTLVTERDQLLQKLELAHAELAKYRAREVDL